MTIPALIRSLVLLVVAQDPAVRVPDYPAPAEVRAAFFKLLDRPRVPLDPKVLAAPSGDVPEGCEEEGVSIASERRPDGSEERVPMLIVRPKDRSRRLPAVILLHGTGGGREGMRPWCNDLARRGIVAVAIDARHHASRAVGKHSTPVGAYHDAIVRAWKGGPGEPRTFPFYFDTCWDVWRTIDYLQTREDVDPDRIGLFGISKGGIETWLAGAADDRVKVAVPAISVQSFRWSLDNDRWQGRAATISVPHKVAANDRGEEAVTRETCRALWSKIIPGILDRFDCPSMLRLYAGRPLLIVNGETDPNCPIEGARVAFAAAEAAYKAAGSPEKLKIDVAEGVGHSITPAQKAMILDWFAKWL